MLRLWGNPLFQRVRTEIANTALKVRGSSPIGKEPEEIKNKLMVLVGLEKALELFDDFAKDAMGVNEKPEVLD